MLVGLAAAPLGEESELELMVGRRLAATAGDAEEVVELVGSSSSLGPLGSSSSSDEEKSILCIGRRL